MPFEVFVAVILSAVAHAGWNALLKAETDRNGIYKTMCLVQLVIGAAVLVFVPFPSLASLPYVAASATIGVGAMLLLSWAYRLGDLGQAYPLSRGTAPLIVALISIGFLGETLAVETIAGILIIGTGIISLSLARGAQGLRNGPVVAVSLANGGLIAACGLLDGYGARLSGSTHGYVALMATVLSVLLYITLSLMERGAAPKPSSRRTRLIGALVGVISLSTAWVAIWAMTRAPIPVIAALRETSIVFAIVIGVLFFKEPLTRWRVAAISLVVVGAAVLRLV